MQKSYHDQIIFVIWSHCLGLPRDFVNRIAFGVGRKTYSLHILGAEVTGGYANEHRLKLTKRRSAQSKLITPFSKAGIHFLHVPLNWVPSHKRRRFECWHRYDSSSDWPNLPCLMYLQCPLTTPVLTSQHLSQTP